MISSVHQIFNLQRSDTIINCIHAHLAMRSVSVTAARDVGEDADSICVSSDSCRIMHDNVTRQRVSVGKE